MILCSQCKARVLIDEDLLICQTCGWTNPYYAPQEELKMICPDCGNRTSIDDDRVTCNHCDWSMDYESYCEEYEE